MNSKSKSPNSSLIIKFLITVPVVFICFVWLSWSFFSRLEITGPIIIASMSFIGIFTSALLISWQVSTQHENTISQQQEKFKDELKLKIYNELANSIEKAHDLIIESNALIQKVPSNLSHQIFTEQELGLGLKEIEDRIENILLKISILSHYLLN